MANNSANVTAGKPRIGGGIYIAPAGTTLPTDAKTALSSDFLALGYVSEDGVVNSNSPESENIKAWGGDNVLTIMTSREDTFTFTLIEVMNINVLKLVYGDDNVTGALSTGIAVTANNGDLESHVIVIDTILKGGVMQRTVIPAGTVSEVGDITYKDDEAVGFETTVSCEADASGNTHYTYIQS